MKETKITNGLLLRSLTTCKQWWWLWIASTVVFGALGLSYVVFMKKDVWVASQGLIVRDEANGAVMRLGRFQSQTEMKAAQETIIELAHNPQVLQDALKKVGSEPGVFGNLDPAWPTAKDIETFAKKNIEVRAPRGAEFGTTEVIYLDTKHTSRKRVYDLNVAICESLQNRLQQMRKVRADGVISELVTASDMARRELNAITLKLQTIESDAGPDLSDLRGMTDAVSNSNSSRQQLDTVKTEIRQAELQLQELDSDLRLAELAFADPDQILAPNSLLNSQPGLKKLREGLADARLIASQLQGRFTAEHPLVLAAIQAEQEIQLRLHEELGLARQSLVSDAQNRRSHIEKLRQQQASLESRLERLASIRADYGNLVNEVRSRTQILQDAERQLSEAQAARDAAGSTSLITRIDDPRVGETPEGPGRATIMAGATVSGLFFGLGIVFLLTPIDGGAGYGRRKNDFSTTQGRRAADQFPEARQADGPFGRRGAQAGSQVPIAPSAEPHATPVNVAAPVAAGSTEPKPNSEAKIITEPKAELEKGTRDQAGISPGVQSPQPTGAFPLREAAAKPKSSAKPKSAAEILPSAQSAFSPVDFATLPPTPQPTVPQSTVPQSTVNLSSAEGRPINQQTGRKPLPAINLPVKSE